METKQTIHYSDIFDLKDPLAQDPVITTCGLFYSQLNNMPNHIRSANPQEMTCEACEEKFKERIDKVVIYDGKGNELYSFRSDFVHVTQERKLNRHHNPYTGKAKFTTDKQFEVKIRAWVNPRWQDED